MIPDEIQGRLDIWRKALLSRTGYLEVRTLNSDTTHISEWEFVSVHDHKRLSGIVTSEAFELRYVHTHVEKCPY